VEKYHVKIDVLKTKELKVGDIMLVESGRRYLRPREPRSEWPRGKILEMIEGEDGVICGATVFVSTASEPKGSKSKHVLDQRIVAREMRLLHRQDEKEGED